MSSPQAVTPFSYWPAAAVQVKMRRLFQPLEFEENLPALGAGGQFEMLAIPADALVVGLVAAAVADERAIVPRRSKCAAG